MYKVPLSKVKLESKLSIIREAIVELETIGRSCTEEEFVTSKEKFPTAEHYLRRALEAVFDIGGHIISRFSYSSGKRPKTMREIALALGEKGIVDKVFAEKKLAEMAGYRNRLVHFYDEVTPVELYQIITRDLNDLETFASVVVDVVREPSRFDVAVDE
ncbi:DUF86 domain-containing protein [Candidatus Kaiserbacteria bacterium]|nr:DUF86 domain-containing protein [Candidatus Kaiserbacteria bacterium]